MKNAIIERFEKAVRDHDAKGTYMPADHAAIEEEYQNAKRAIEELIENAIGLQIIPVAVPKINVLTPELLADALDCFWNAAIGHAHNAQSTLAMDTAGSIAEGFAAIANRLRGM